MFCLFVWLVGWLVRSFVLFVLFGLAVLCFQFVAFGGFSLFHVFGCLLVSLLFVCVVVGLSVCVSLDVQTRCRDVITNS